MTLHLERDLGALKEEILTVGSLVEEATNKAILALMERRDDLAREVMNGDHLIDTKEVEVEEECLKILALHQPVAADLRFIVGIIKVNNDLERMGDLAVNISKRAAYLASRPPIPLSLDFPAMGDKTRTMVNESLDSLVRLDTNLAQKVCMDDDQVDDHLKNLFEQLQGMMFEDPKVIKRCIHMLTAARHLERIADLATNIAEDVIFMVAGNVVRHRMGKDELPADND